MRIFVHDYAGHPFQVELSRNLAERGHHITHAYFAGDQGPKGQMARQLEDSNNFNIIGIEINQKYSKKNLIKRRTCDISYGKKLASVINELKPEIVISGNTPTEAQKILMSACKSVNSRFIYWCQDFYSIAATKILKKNYHFWAA